MKKLTDVHACLEGKEELFNKGQSLHSFEASRHLMVLLSEDDCGGSRSDYDDYDSCV